MSRKLTVIFVVLLVLVTAMSLKTAIAAHSDGTLHMAVGGAPQPPPIWDIRGTPQPPAPLKVGGAPQPPPIWD